MDLHSTTFPDPRRFIVVEAVSANVRREGDLVSMSGREREVALAIALQEQPATTVRLAEMLYPDREYVEAANVVKVYVCRLRKRVGQDFIRWHDGGYAIGAHVSLDLTLARALVDRLSRYGEEPEPAEHEAMLALARGLRREAPARLTEFDWYAAVARRARRVGHELAMLVGRSALRHGNAADAARVGRELTFEDPCDEEGWELLIGANVALGQHLAAIQDFRFYESVLARELDAAPSPHIRRLIGEAAAFAGDARLTA